MRKLKKFKALGEVKKPMDDSWFHIRSNIKPTISDSVWEKIVENVMHACRDQFSISFEIYHNVDGKLNEKA